MPSKKIAVLFPGQGSQDLGMGQKFIESSESARELLAMAEAVSGSPLGKLCNEGPMEELTLAHNLQPSLTVTSLICWQALKSSGVKVDFFAGHSLGEYAALCASGVLSPEDTIKLVTERGRLMGRAGIENPGGMCAIIGLAIAEVEEILLEIASPEKLSIGNYNSEQQIVLSGAADLLLKAAGIAQKKGGKAIPLNVSVANHSPLMNGVVPEFERIITSVNFESPKVPVYSNVTGKIENEPQIIRQVMAAQIKSMVRWLDIINGLLAQNVEIFIEVGPKKVLSGLMKRILPRKSGLKCLQVDSPETLEKCLAEIS